MFSVELRVARSDTGPWDLATDISHKSGNHLTNRHSQPPPTRGFSLLSAELRGHQSLYWNPPDVVWALRRVLGSDNCHLIVNFDAKNSKSLVWLSIFPRGAARPVSRARYCSSLTHSNRQKLEPVCRAGPHLDSEDLATRSYLALLFSLIFNLPPICVRTGPDHHDPLLAENISSFPESEVRVAG